MDTAELIKLAQNGDKHAEEELIKENSRLVWSIVMRFSDRGYDREDLYQIGVIGLLKAIKRFDFKYGVRFSTYAVPMMIGEIKRFLRDDGIIKVSRGLKELSAKVLNAKESFEKKHGRPASLSDIASMLDISTEQAAQALEVPRHVTSLNEFISEDSSATRGEMCPDAGSDSERIIESIALKMAVASLEERERRIVKLRYFMDKTQTQTAEALGISQVQVSRLEKKILAKIREKIV